MSKPKIIVAGVKTYTNKKAIAKVLSSLKESVGDFELVVGNDKGPEEIAKDWAEFAGVDFKNIPIEWKNVDVEGAEVEEGQYGKYNRKAGIMRIRKVIDYADHLVAFWDGEDVGTSILINFADRAELKKKVFLIQPDQELKEETGSSENESDNLPEGKPDDDDFDEDF